MYLPKAFQEPDRGRIESLIRAYPFGTLTTVVEGRPYVSHLPFLLEEGDLVCHLARANPQCGHLSGGEEVLAIFSGPHGYISPNWCVHAGVPTWNYAVVQVRGEPILMEQEDELRGLVERMSRHFEAGLDDPWAPRFDLKLLQAILGVRIRITSIEAKFKLNQNRSLEDRERIIGSLEARGDPVSKALAALMRETSD